MSLRGCTIRSFAAALGSCLLLAGVLGPSRATAEEEIPAEMEAEVTALNERLHAIEARIEELRLELSAAPRGRASAEVIHELQQLQGERHQALQGWRSAIAPSLRDGEQALSWDAEDGSLGQLLSDYAPPDLIYLVPPALAALKLHLHSRLPIPEAAWEECLEAILAQMGIGIRKPHSCIRELYLMQEDLAYLPWLLSERPALQALAQAERVAFFLSVRGEQAQALESRLRPFVRQETVHLLAMGDTLVLIGPCGEVRELLKLTDFLADLPPQRQYRLFNVTKTTPDEMARLLTAVFELPSDPREAQAQGLKIFPLASVNQALLVVGSPEQLRRVEAVLRDLEGTLDDPAAKTIYYYRCEHTPPDELAAVLERVYCMLQECDPAPTAQQLDPKVTVTPRTCLDVNRPFCGTAPPQCPAGPVNPTPIAAAVPAKQALVSGGNNFIVDGKSGSILMVVEQRLLPQLQELARRLDVPKRMVQLDVLLVERRVKNHLRSGLNLLRIGTAASQSTATSLVFDGKPGAGLLEFLISREKTCSTPAYDLVYNFLLNQEDVQINANPSVLTVNQTTSTISLVEEISINNGAVSCCDVGSAVIQKSYVRAQYGITLVLTPTIHLPETGQGGGSVTLDTNITFDSTRAHPDDRPDVVRRHIENQVRVADGETVVLGGLRRRLAETSTESIPFLGEIPGLGKLFSSAQMDDHETEMFIFITPKIVLDPKEQLRRIRQEELCKRPGDLPEFIVCLEQAKAREHHHLFAHSLALFTDRWPDAQTCLQEASCAQD